LVSRLQISQVVKMGLRMVLYVNKGGRGTVMNEKGSRGRIGKETERLVSKKYRLEWLH
jgi:hypothetical protein